MSYRSSARLNNRSLYPHPWPVVMAVAMEEAGELPSVPGRSLHWGLVPTSSLEEEHHRRRRHHHSWQR
jgi:hypothetical protein